MRHLREMTPLFTVVLACFWAAVPASADLLGPPAVKVSITWEYKNFPSKIELYELKGYPALWEMKNLPALDHGPLTKKIEGSAFTLKPGEVKRFALVAKNDTAKPVYFFAAPHSAHPAESSLGLNFNCLCVGHAYHAEPGQYWYRVVELRLAKDYVGSELAINHTIVGIDEKRAEAFSPDRPADGN